MAHQHIESRFDPEESKLTPEQQYAWSHIRSAFGTAGMAAPRPGFMERWDVRFTEHRRESEKRTAWTLLGINAAIASILFVLMLVQAWMGLSSPVDLLAGWAERIAGTAAFLEAMMTTIASLGRALPGLVPAPLWLSALAGAVALVGLWSMTLKRYALNQGVLK